MALNDHFRKAATSVKALEKHGKGMFGALLSFAHDHRTNGADALKAQFKEQEGFANAELKIEMTKNSTYKVAKGKLVKAVELGIDLMPNGKPIGKTALEDAIKAAEGKGGKKGEGEGEEKEPEMAPSEKFSALMVALRDVAKALPDEHVLVAAAQVNDLYVELAKRIPMPKAA